MFSRNIADVQTIAVSSLMSSNRFDEIIQNLHLVDTSTLDPNEKFSKVRPLTENLNNQCLLHYLQEQTVSTDESNVPYFIRHGRKQFMRKKLSSLDTSFGLLLPPLGYTI